MREPREMSPGAFAAASRLSAKALRIYAESGLLVPARTDPFTGYRYYRADQLERARLIAALRRIGMPLARVRRAADAGRAAALAAVAAYWREVEADVATRRELTALLLDELSGKEIAMMDVSVRTMPDRVLLSAKRHLTAGELAGWSSRQAELLGDGSVPGLPGIEGAPFLVYHGEVSQDSDGPVEYCRAVPADRAAEIAARFPGLELREDPAHREAYVRLTAAELGAVHGERAFGTLARWAAEQGETPAGPPRQVFFADPRDASPDTPVSDVVGPLPLLP
ncbi:MerR family transcriptional regulator [Streptomyces sp. SL13]|uniref:MerR family transcriptional regulator n=1 Tax=Streptantibioticus silvisoli TaxID=2705255 RepID=A0AA90KAD1_9ACTN|nr:MerR family transcriptional regulator [Streptantibioticus silvisoli]MDI5966558.1 MerR family transcriptional regulator [Streptantibioticus silvisoli]MDI5972268.1 MerR family transcriptional regulator [Streptantibioticus silvisoli]